MKNIKTNLLHWRNVVLEYWNGEDYQIIGGKSGSIATIFVLGLVVSCLLFLGTRAKTGIFSEPKREAGFCSVSSLLMFLRFTLTALALFQ